MSVTSYFWQFVDHWQSLIAGVFALVAAITAVLLAIWNERRKAKRELASLRRSLGVEVRQHTWNACRVHEQLKALIVGHIAPIPAIFVEDKAKLPPPQIYIGYRSDGEAGSPPDARQHDPIVSPRMAAQYHFGRR
jgi:hypothetical protein